MRRVLSACPRLLALFLFCKFREGMPPYLCLEYSILVFKSGAFPMGHMTFPSASQAFFLVDHVTLS